MCLCITSLYLETIAWNRGDLFGAERLRLKNSQIGMSVKRSWSNRVSCCASVSGFCEKRAERERGQRHILPLFVLSLFGWLVVCLFTCFLLLFSLLIFLFCSLFRLLHITIIIRLTSLESLKMIVTPEMPIFPLTERPTGGLAVPPRSVDEPEPVRDFFMLPRLVTPRRKF